MRFELLYNPGLLCERLGYKAQQRRRLKKLRHTPARNLAVGHIESLELLECTRVVGIKVIYDVGANVGTWSLLARSVIPEASIEAFEPIPKHHISFNRILRGVEGVNLHPLALGSQNTSAVLRVTDFSDASSFLPLAEASRTQFGVKEVEQLETQMRRLDDYRLEQKMAFPDLIKLDVQGYELEILKGASECLRAAKAVVVEVSFIEYYRGQCLFHDVVEFLAQFGLLLTALGVHTRLGTEMHQTDALFLRRQV